LLGEEKKRVCLTTLPLVPCGHTRGAVSERFESLRLVLLQLLLRAPPTLSASWFGCLGFLFLADAAPVAARAQPVVAQIIILFVICRCLATMEVRAARGMARSVRAAHGPPIIEHRRRRPTQTRRLVAARASRKSLRQKWLTPGREPVMSHRCSRSPPWDRQSFLRQWETPAGPRPD